MRPLLGPRDIDYSLHSPAFGGWLVGNALLLITSVVVTPVLAEEQGFFGKLKLAFDYLKDPGLLIAYIKNEIINPLLHKDPHSRYKEIVKKSGTTPTSEPEYMKKVKEKLNGYFARLNGYNLTADQLVTINELGVKDVTLAVMDSQRTYYVKHIYISGDVVKVDGRATPNMVSITPRATYELVLMLDDFFEIDSFEEATTMAQSATEGKIETMTRVIAIDSAKSFGNRTVIIPLDVDVDDVIEAKALTGSKELLEVREGKDGKAEIVVPATVFEGSPLGTQHAEIKVIYNKKPAWWEKLPFLKSLDGIFEFLAKLFGFGR